METQDKRISQNEKKVIEKIFYEKVCGLEPEFIHFLKTCDINVLENAWKYRSAIWLNNKDIPEQIIKDLVRRMKSWLHCFTGYQNNKPTEVEIAGNEYFFNSKKYSSLIEAAKDCGTTNGALKYAIGNGRLFIKRRKDKKIFYLRPIN